MASVNVSTQPEFLNTSMYPDLRNTLQTVVAQNLGPDSIYLDFVENANDLTTENGIQLIANGIYEIPSYDAARPIAIVSAGESDVRILAVD